MTANAHRFQFLASRCCTQLRLLQELVPPQRKQLQLCRQQELVPPQRKQLQLCRQQALCWRPGQLAAHTLAQPAACQFLGLRRLLHSPAQNR
jgi:hypothetical protein